MPLTEVNHAAPGRDMGEKGTQENDGERQVQDDKDGTAHLLADEVGHGDGQSHRPKQAKPPRTEHMVGRIGLPGILSYDCSHGHHGDNEDIDGL